MTAPKVYDAIAAVMAEIGSEGIAKDRRNQQQGYSFRGIDEVYNALSPILARNKLCILPRILAREVVERATKNGSALFYVTVEAEFDLVSAEDGSKHTVRTFGEAMDSADKATNKAMSAAYKYAAMQAFCIPTEGDNDADATTHEVAPKTFAHFLSDVQNATGLDDLQAVVNEAHKARHLSDSDKHDIKEAARARREQVTGAKAYVPPSFENLPADTQEMVNNLSAG